MTNINFFEQLYHFAEEHFVSFAKDVLMAHEELLQWIESLETDPHDSECLCYLSLAEAKQIVAMIRENKFQL